MHTIVLFLIFCAVRVFVLKRRQVCDLLVGKPPARVSIEEFLDGQSSFDVIIYDNDRPEAKEDTAAIAIMAIDDPSWKEERYNLLTHNCEHFSKFCRMGVKISPQVQKGATKAGSKAGISTGVVSVSGSIDPIVGSISSSVSGVCMYCAECTRQSLDADEGVHI